MARRGPDDAGIWHDNEHCVLGFRRLAILDLSPAGHQPMQTADGRFTLVFNGEVYNFRELRRELEQKGARFRSSGDAEVVLQALAQWGTAALDRFNGMFALGFYDVLKKRLLLARDHAGIKPLYYLLCTQGLVFASQYDQILRHPWSRGIAVSTDARALYLRLGYIPAPYAWLANTHMLEAGSWLQLDASGRMERGAYFRFPVRPTSELRGEQAWEAVDAAVTSAVRRQKVSDVPIGAFLSGGIDSPLVAAKLRSAVQSDVKAFTLGTDVPELDEAADASRYAGELGITQIIERATERDALAMLDEALSASSEPFADYSIIPTLLIARAARKSVTVILSGDGGDELFWGYAERFASVLESAASFAQPRWQRRLRWGIKKKFKHGAGHRNWHFPSIGDWYRAKHSHLKEEMLRDIFPACPGWPGEFALYRYDGFDPEETAQWLRWNEFVGHLARVLLKVDRASMHHSLEVRVPLLDREVIDVALRVNWQSCLSLAPLLGKLPLRKSLARHARFQTTQKKGFSIPMDNWLRGPLRQIFQEAVLERSELAGLPIDRIRLQHLFERHQARELNCGWGLWSLLSLALWEQKYLQASLLKA
jgi:asparagine synthase (glutamine-hydrolysing)